MALILRRVIRQYWPVLAPRWCSRGTSDLRESRCPGSLAPKQPFDPSPRDGAVPSTWVALERGDGLPTERHQAAGGQGDGLGEVVDLWLEAEMGGRGQGGSRCPGLVARPSPRTALWGQVAIRSSLGVHRPPATPPPLWPVVTPRLLAPTRGRTGSREPCGQGSSHGFSRPWRGCRAARRWTE